MQAMVSTRYTRILPSDSMPRSARRVVADSSISDHTGVIIDGESDGHRCDSRTMVVDIMSMTSLRS